MEQDKYWKSKNDLAWIDLAILLKRILPIADVENVISGHKELIDHLIEAERTKAVEEDREMLIERIEEKRLHPLTPYQKGIEDSLQILIDIIRNHSKKV